MFHTRSLYAAAALIAGVSLPVAAPGSALATATLNLSSDLHVFVPFPDAGAWWFEYNAVANAERHVRVFDPETKRWVFDIVPTGAAGVVVRTVLPSPLTVNFIVPRNGFACAHTSNVVTCTGDIPSAGSVSAAIISTTQVTSLATRYSVSTTVDPANVVAETVETDNTAWCNASAYEGRC